MNTKKNVLEKMSDRELEQYIKPDSKFVPEAIQYAFEILQSRGRTFTNEEKDRINSLVSKVEPNDTIIHPHYTKAAHFIYLSGATGIAGLIWTSEQLNSGLAIFISVAVIAFVFGIGYMIGKGNIVAKYLFIILFAIGLLGMPTIITHLRTDPILATINVLQLILQTWAVVLLLKIPKNIKG